MRHNLAALGAFTKVLKVTLDCEMLNLPDTFRMLLARFASMAWSTPSEPIVLSLPDLAWLSKFLQSKQNFSNHLVNVLWSTVPSPFAQQMFWLFPWHHCKVWTCIAYVAKLDCCIFIKSCIQWNSALTSILPTWVGTSHSLNSVVWHMHHKLAPKYYKTFNLP